MNKVVSLKCSPDEHEAWKRAAGPSSFNSWARSVLNAAVKDETWRHANQSLDSTQLVAGQIEAKQLVRTVEPGPWKPSRQRMNSTMCVHHKLLTERCVPCGG